MDTSKEYIDLWNLTEPMPDFPDEYEIWETQVYTIYEAVGEKYKGGSIVGYVETTENPEYNEEYASGRYNLKLYYPNGKFMLDYSPSGDEVTQWAGLRKLPFVGYVEGYRTYINSIGYEEGVSPLGHIWIIIPKSKEQLLSAAAAFYKKMGKEDEAPNIEGLSSYLGKETKIGGITDISTFVPMRKRKKGVRPSATKKKLAEYRATAPEVTDELLAEAIKKGHEGFFIDYEEVAVEAIKETYREQLPLTIENALQQLEYMIEDRKLLKYYTSLQERYHPSPEAIRIKEKANEVIEKVYEEGCKRVLNLSEIADEEVIDFIDKSYSNSDDMTLAKKLNNFCCGVHCRKHDLISCMIANDFPPFRCFDRPSGKDVTLAPTLEEAEEYNGEEMDYGYKYTAHETKQDYVETELTKETNRKIQQIIEEAEKRKAKQSGGNGCLLWLLAIPSSALLAMLLF